MLSARRSLTGRVTGEEDLHTGKGKMKKKYLLIIVLIAACMLLSAGVTAGRPEYASAATVFRGKELPKVRIS